MKSDFYVEHLLFQKLVSASAKAKAARASNSAGYLAMFKRQEVSSR